MTSYGLKMVPDAHLTAAHRERLQLLAARLVFNTVATDTVVEIAHELLNAGVYDDSLLAIIDAPRQTQEEVIPPFRKFLQHSGIALPDRERSVWMLLSHYIHRIASAPSDPLTPLDELIKDLFWNCGLGEQPGNSLGESHGLHHLIGRYWLNDDMLDHPESATYNGKSGVEAIEELKDKIRGDALAWLRQYGP